MQPFYIWRIAIKLLQCCVLRKQCIYICLVINFCTLHASSRTALKQSNHLCHSL